MRRPGAAARAPRGRRRRRAGSAAGRGRSGDRWRRSRARRSGSRPSSATSCCSCAAVELDSAFGPALRAAQRRSGAPLRHASRWRAPRLPDAHWSALLPAAPLRHWQLIELDAGETRRRRSSQARLGISERVLHHLLGLTTSTTRFSRCSRAVSRGGGDPGRTHAAAAAHPGPAGSGEVRGAGVMLSGGGAQTRRNDAAAACGQLGVRLFALDAATMSPATPTERDRLARPWKREALLSPRRAARRVRRRRAPQAAALAGSIGTRGHRACREPLAVAERSDRSRLRPAPPTSSERRGVVARGARRARRRL